MKQATYNNLKFYIEIHLSGKNIGLAFSTTTQSNNLGMILFIYVSIMVRPASEEARICPERKQLKRTSDIALMGLDTFLLAVPQSSSFVVAATKPDGIVSL